MIYDLAKMLSMAGDTQGKEAGKAAAHRSTAPLA